MFYNIFQKSRRDLSRTGNNQSGQALIELSVFGGLILLVLAVIVSYGLKYDFQQQSSMEAFRTAQQLAQEIPSDSDMRRGTASFTLIKDRHIPDPTNPYGVGQVSPVVASASFTRDPRLDFTADNYVELPRMFVRVEGNPTDAPQWFNFTTAGRAMDEFSDISSAEHFNRVRTKYVYIYGSVGFWCEATDKTYYDEGGDKNQDFVITIIDSVEGEVVDFNTAIRQARMIVDRDFFVKMCRRQAENASERNKCAPLSEYEIKVPWYVRDCTRNNLPISLPDRYAGAWDEGDTWYFPRIEQLFINPAANSKRIASLGLQADTVQTTEKVLSLDKHEDEEAIQTTDDLYWSTVTTRAVVIHDHLNKTTGREILGQRGNLQATEFNTTRSEDERFTWRTEQ